MFFAFVGKLSLKLTNANVGHRLETEDDQICFGEKKFRQKFFPANFFSRQNFVCRQKLH
jgi:hypothetical protein